jgi:site-specific DNA-methyltransferase (adenine-specific)
VHFHGRGRGAKYARPEIQCSRTGGTWAAKYQQGKRDINYWDVAPPPKYFKELFRVSKNQIIWGGNYFGLPPTRCFLVWRKPTVSETFSMAMCEYAWTSFNGNAKWIELAPQGTAKEQRFHPTQKPVALYAWVLNNFAKKGDKILDTHAGSASSLIACIDAGYQYMGFEIDGYYFRMAHNRIADRLAQTSLFDKDGQDADRQEQDRQLDLDYGHY